MSESTVGFHCSTSARYNPLENVLTHTHTQKKQSIQVAWRSSQKVSGSSSSVLLMSSRTCCWYLSSFPNRVWHRKPVCNQFQNGLESFRPGAPAAHLCVHWGFFDKVLCIKVTITFITDVVYIFDILMFILFCEEESTFRKIQKLVMCVYWYCTGSDLCFVTPPMAKSMLDIF